MYTFIFLGLPGLLIAGLGMAAVKFRWIPRARRWLTGDTRVIVEPATTNRAVRCGKCHCRFTFTAQDVYAGYAGSTLSCPSCNQTIRLWNPETGDFYGVEP